MDTMKLSLFGALLAVLGLSLAGCGGGSSSSSSSSSSACSGCIYTVSGTLTGYTTSGLALTLTDTSSSSTLQTLTNIANTSTTFSFPSGKVPQGHNWAVTANKPTGQTCTVSNGSGSNIQGDVGNVAVSCVKDTYTISGTNTLGATLSISGSSLANTPTNAATFSFNALYGDTVTLTAVLPTYNCTVSTFTNPISSAVSGLTTSCTSGAAGAVVTTLAGSGAQGSTDATGTAATFYIPEGVAVDAAGNVYVADTGNHIIRKITPAGVVTTLAGSGAVGSTDATGTAASFFYPYGVAVDAAGNVYVADTFSNKIRKITPAGMVTTLAGSGTAGSTDATGTAASFNLPSGVAVDAAGNVYVADTFSNKIRKISPAGGVTTLAGEVIGNTDGTGTAASFWRPYGVAVDVAGNVYVADTNNNEIRKITPAGVVTTLAGSGAFGSTDGTGTAASFNLPHGVAVDAAGNVYVADYMNNKIRKISPAGVVTTLAGSGAVGSTDGTDTAATFNHPPGVAVDAAGKVYVADWGNNKIRKLTP